MKTLKANQNPSWFKELWHLKWQTVELQHMLIINSVIILASVCVAANTVIVLGLNGLLRHTCLLLMTSSPLSYIDDNIEWRPDKQLKFWTYILKSSLKDWEDGYTSHQIIGPAVRHVRPSYWHEMCFCCQNVMCNGQGTLSLLPAQVVTVCASFSAILFKRLDSLIFTVAKLTVVHKQTQVDWFRSMQGGIRSLAR